MSTGTGNYNRGRLIISKSPEKMTKLIFCLFFSLLVHTTPSTHNTMRCCIGTLVLPVDDLYWCDDDIRSSVYIQIATYFERIVLLANVSQIFGVEMICRYVDLSVSTTMSSNYKNSFLISKNTKDITINDEGALFPRELNFHSFVNTDNWYYFR